MISLDYHETLMAASGAQAEAALRAAIEDNAGKYVLVIEGSIPAKDDGVFMELGGKPAIQVAKDVAAQAAAVIAIGSCASWGGVPSADPNPTGAVGVDSVISGKPIINLPGCPPNPYNLLAVVLEYVTMGRLPQMDEFNRPKFAYDRVIHENCPRRAHFDAGRFATTFGDEGHRKGWCLYKLGCKGPVTHAACATRHFNEVPGVWPIGIGSLGMDKLEMISTLLAEVSQFVQQVYFVDVCAVAAMYPEWFKIGSGVRNYLAVPDLPLDSQGSSYDLPGGYIRNGDLAAVKGFQSAADPSFRQSVSEDVMHAYYQGEKALHPWQGETEPAFTGWDGEQKYSWVKAPRFNSEPMQVGPLAQVLIGYAQGHALTRKYADLAIEKIAAIGGVRATPAMLHSTPGRHAARAIRACMLAELAQKHWQLLVNNIAKGDYKVYNAPVLPSHEVEGVGTHEAPRGTLSHWIVIKDEKIKNYQAVVPSTWNASPRDRAGAHGPYEASLLHTPLARPEEPLEVLRTVHSFDPCMACACHAFDPAGRKIAVAKIL